MTDDNDITAEEGLDALATVRELNSEVFEGVDDASTHIDGARETAHDLQDATVRMAEAASEAEDLASDLLGGGRYGPSHSLDDAFEALGRPFDITDGEMQRFLKDIEAALEAAEQGETEPAGTVTIGDTTYEVTLTEVEDEEGETEEPKGGFGGWLYRLIEETVDLNATLIAHETSVENIGGILNDGEEPTYKEIEGMLTFLHESGVITEEEYEDAQTVFLPEPETE